MLMESYIWFIVRSRSADEYHLYWRQERDGAGGFIRSASGYYRSVINIVPLAGTRPKYYDYPLVALPRWENSRVLS